MKCKTISICSLVFSTAAFGQELPPSQTVFFEQDTFIQPELLIKKPIESDLKLPVLSENSSLEEYINQAIIEKDWKKLEKLLDRYKQTDQYDHILYNYGLGALYRFQGEQKKAIETYKDIVQHNPDLHYPRFDLAMMLFEDKQYTEAKHEFEMVKPFLPSQIQALIDQILISMRKSQDWETKVNFNFKNTNNVNQSSDIKEIQIGDAVFVRDKESLPQKAQGIGYYLGISREYNIVDNHYLYVNTGLDGVSYWDNKDYSEQTIRIDSGYKYKDIKQSIGVTPLFAQNILGDSRYSRNYGVGLDYNRILSDRWQLSANTSHIQKKYQNIQLAKYYDGYSNSQSAMLIHQLKPKVIVYGGADFMQDRLLDHAESSTRKGVRVGAMYFGNIIGLSANLKYAKRDFLANNFLYSRQREDNEWNASISAWHKKWQWHNFTPKLNYEYQKIDSNLSLYERNNNSWFITIEKVF